jgi:DNA-binding SARP family transcriptional activator
MNKPSLPIRVGVALTALLVLLVLAPVLELRPRLPGLPSPHQTLDLTATIQALFGLAAWALALALLLWAFHGCLHALLRRSPPQTPHALHRDLARQLRPAPTRPRLPRRNPLAQPYALTLARPTERRPHTAASAATPIGTAQAVLTEEEPPAAVETRSKSEPRRVAIKLIGPPAIEGLPKRRRGLRGESRQLLYYLALHPHGASRDQLLAALWPDHDDKRARQHLYQAAADLRTHLKTAFLADRNRYQLDRNQLAIDVDQLDTLLRQADDPAAGDRHITPLEQALQLVRGQPLAGLDTPWAASEARHLHATIIDLLERLGHARLNDGQPAAALHAAEQAIELDQLNEDLWQLAMHAEAALGLREALIARYDTLTQLLDERLGLQPQSATRALYLTLLGQD